MKGKGFTLIELLAVIVILAVIALIATPIVLKLIDKSRRGAAESDAYAYISAVETSVVDYLMEHKDADVSGIYTTQADGSLKGTSELTINIKNNIKLNGLLVVSELKPEVKGETPEAGTIITINTKGTVDITQIKDMEIGGYKISYDESFKKLKAGSSNEKITAKKIEYTNPSNEKTNVEESLDDLYTKLS